MAETAAVSLSPSLAREEAFARIVSRELTSAYRTATVLLRDPAEAEDATQDALVRAWQGWDALRDKERAGAWFGRILVNVCRDRLRARRGPVIGWRDPGSSADPSTRLDERDALEDAFARLTVEQRIVVALRFYLDLPTEAIAERTGVPPGTVKSRLHHALRALRAAYEAEERAIEVER